MENRRPPSQNNSKSFNRGNNFRKPAGKPFGERKFNRGDNNVQFKERGVEARDNRFEPRNRFRKPDERNSGANNKFRSAPGKFTEGKRFNKPKDRQFSPREKENLPRIVSEMQVTDGKLRGKYLLNLASPNTRSTARRLREIMFKILFRRIRAKRFLDLCAGSGMVGIEAISRGAILGTFVERSAKLCTHIKKNLEACGIKEGHGEIFEAECIPFLKKMEKRKRCWDVIFYDPPYDVNYDEVLSYFGRGATINNKGVLVIEHPSEMFFPEKFGLMQRWRVVTQGNTALSFYEKIKK